MEGTLREIFIANLKFYRKKRDLSQQNLSLELEKSINYINGIESSGSFPSVDMIEKISGILEIEPMLLFDRHGCPENVIRFDREEFAKLVAEECYRRLDASFGRNAMEEAIAEAERSYFRKN